MGLDKILNTPKVTIDQSRYEDLIKKELKYEQYKKRADRYIIGLIEGGSGNASKQ